MAEPSTAEAPVLGQAEADPHGFIRANTAAVTPPLVPELRLHLASEVVPLWHMTEAELNATGLPPPYWAFAWAGGQALARHVLDHPEIVRGRRVLDFGAGSGLVGLAAARSGAAHVTAAEIDRFAGVAIALNAELNGLTVEVVVDDLVGRPAAWDVVLAADICYERPAAERIEAWLRDQARAGTLVLIGDPGRLYLPKHGLERLATYSVATTRELEDTDLRRTSVWRVVP
jgi:predicted nicotinamide N-methyase